MQAFDRRSDLPNLLVDDAFAKVIRETQQGLRASVGFAQQFGIPVPAMSASLAYFDSYRSAQLPQNLTQAQRDFFGAHTYVRSDRPEAGAVHTDWPALIANNGGKR
jgi:6-phosphogluconate dehydrogenase